MEFFDFEIRAWRTDKTHIQAIVHSSPAGDMEKPIKVVFDGSNLGQEQRGQPSWFSFSSTSQAIEIGKRLSAALLPRPIEALLSRSLELIDPGAGLRMRLCLDEALVGFPWEYLFRPDAPVPDSLAGFLIPSTGMSSKPFFGCGARPGG